MQKEQGEVAPNCAGMRSSPCVLSEQLDPKTMVGYLSFTRLLRCFKRN